MAHGLAPREKAVSKIRQYLVYLLVPFILVYFYIQDIKGLVKYYKGV